MYRKRHSRQIRLKPPETHCSPSPTAPVSTCHLLFFLSSLPFPALLAFQTHGIPHLHLVVADFSCSIYLWGETRGIDVVSRSTKRPEFASADGGAVFKIFCSSYGISWHVDLWWSQSCSRSIGRTCRADKNVRWGSCREGREKHTQMLRRYQFHTQQGKEPANLALWISIRFESYWSFYFAHNLSPKFSMLPRPPIIPMWAQNIPLNSSGICEITYAIVSDRPVCFSPVSYSKSHSITFYVCTYQCLRDGIRVRGRQIAHFPSKAPAPPPLAFAYRSPPLCRLSVLVEQHWVRIGYSQYVKLNWLKNQGGHILE